MFLQLLYNLVACVDWLVQSPNLSLVWAFASVLVFCLLFSALSSKYVFEVFFCFVLVVMCRVVSSLYWTLFALINIRYKMTLDVFSKKRSKCDIVAAAIPPFRVWVDIDDTCLFHSLPLCRRQPLERMAPPVLSLADGRRCFLASRKLTKPQVFTVLSKIQRLSTYDLVYFIAKRGLTLLHTRQPNLPIRLK
jgi:hypothetical protein